MTARQYEDFKKTCIEDGILDNAIEWIQSNLSPNDVFTVKELEEWVRDYSACGDVFSDKDLTSWALENGFKKETE